MSSRYLELAPSNKTTDSKYSFKKGVAQLTFDIPEGAYLLDPDSIRICGKFNIFKKSDGTRTDTTDPSTDNLSLSSRIGVWSVMNQLIWRSLKHQTTISHEKHWNRWLASYIGLTATPDDSLGWLSTTTLTMPNYFVEKGSVVDKTAGNSFCCHLPCGLLLSGSALNLMPNALGGLSLTIMLESDAMALQVLPADNSTPSAPADYLDAMYELSDVKLVCSVITPPPDQLSQLMKQKSGQINFQSVHSYYDTANSTNIQMAMNLGLKEVKSLFINMISSDKLNNIAEDSFATLSPANDDGSIANISKITFLKGGTTFPKLFPYDTNFKSESKSVVADPNVTREFINSVVSFDKTRSTQICPSNANRNWTNKATGLGTDYRFVNDSGVVWGLGVNYENYLGGSGIDMSKEQFGLAIDCDLTSENAQSMFLFVNAETSIVYNENGVQVLN